MAKVDPYLRPLFDALHDMLDPEKVAAHLERGVIEVAPLAFMRGRTLNDSFVILDEAQNTTPEQMKMFLTRLGFGSKMVITGDITQIDLPRDQQSGLVVVADILERRRRHRVRALRRRGRRAPPARAAHRRGLRRARERAGAGAAPRRADAAVPETSIRARGRGPRRGPSPARRRTPRSSGSSRSRWRRRGVEDGHVGDRVRRRRRGSPSSTREHRGKDGPDRRAVVPDRRAPATGRRRPARARRHRDLPRAHRRTCARRSSTARCTSSAWTTRPTTARCSRCRRSS